VSDKDPQNIFDITDPVPEGQGSSTDEFAHVPSPRRHPAIALSAAAIALFLTYQIRSDCFFALSSTTPVDLGDARKVVQAQIDTLPLNRTVRISGMPDRENGVLLDTQGSWKFTQFLRLMGTQSNLFVRRVADPIPPELAERDVFTGRLTRFRDLSFQEAIRRHFSHRVTANHFFAPEELALRLKNTSSGSLLLADLLGETLTLAPSDQLSIDVPRPEVVMVEMPLEKFPNMASARTALEGKGARVVEEGQADSRSITVTISFPPETWDRAMSDVGDLHPLVRFRPARTTFTIEVANLAVDNDKLRISPKNGARTVLLKDILAVRTLATLQIPDSALLLSEGERPRDHWVSLLIALILLGFAALNLLHLRGKA
jgi:hypothetical protein